MLKKIGPSKYIPTVIFPWDMVMHAMVAVETSAGLLVARFFPGITRYNRSWFISWCHLLFITLVHRHIRLHFRLALKIFLTLSPSDLRLSDPIF